ncbi:MAG TPA: hypothetical protein VNT75_01660 [Symbiobacteriaceae bacterium]|nr:hypothetical protein [Symbiobacteriaceae bacterium]
MLRRYWLALLAAGLLFTTQPAESRHKVILWDRTPQQVSAVAAGTLALAIERGGGDTSPGPLFYGTSFEGQTPDGRPGLLPTGPLAPGDTIRRTLTVRNTGSLDASVTSVSADLTDGSRLLADAMQVLVTADAAGAQPIAWGSLSEFLARPQFFATGVIDLKPGETATLYVWVSLPLSLGNQYQNLRSVVSFGIHAEQRGHAVPPPPVKPPQLG